MKTCQCGVQKARRYSACYKCWNNIDANTKAAMQQTGTIRRYRRAVKRDVKQ